MKRPFCREFHALQNRHENKIQGKKQQQKKKKKKNNIWKIYIRHFFLQKNAKFGLWRLGRHCLQNHVGHCEFPWKPPFPLAFRLKSVVFGTPCNFAAFVRPIVSTDLIAFSISFSVYFDILNFWFLKS